MYQLPHEDKSEMHQCYQASQVPFSLEEATARFQLVKECNYGWEFQLSLLLINLATFPEVMDLFQRVWWKIA